MSWLAWGVVLLAGALGTLALYLLTRKLRWDWLRTLLCWLVPVLLIVPAPVPDFAGNYAPAFVVVVFEAFFQQDGDATVALGWLLGAVCLVVAGVGGYYGILARRRSSQVSSGQ
jgi:hypothetical protein